MTTIQIETPAPIHFATIKEAIIKARTAAEREARKLGRNNYYEDSGRRIAQPFKFVRSRGTRILTINQQLGRVAPCEEPWEYDGTKRELVAVVNDVLANYPQCDEITLEGGFDFSETFGFEDYEPLVTDWAVTIWTRAGGYAAIINA
jgi:hypothetical protein